MIFNNELNISLIKLNVFKHLIVCSVLAPFYTTNSSIQTSITKLSVRHNEAAMYSQDLFEQSCEEV